MSRSIGAIEQEAPQAFIDREALMMDGGRLYFQLTPEDAGGDGLTLADFEGTRVTDASDPTFTGTLRRTSGGGWVVDAGGKPRRRLRLSRGMGLVTAAGRFLSLGPAFAIAEDRLLSQSQLEAFFDPGGSGGDTGPSFASTQAAQTQGEAFQRGENALDRQLQRQRDENAARQNLIDVVATLSSRASDIRRQSEADLMGLEQSALTIINERMGQDPVRGAILSSGLVQRGTTPNEAFIGRAQGVADTARRRSDALTAVPRLDLSANTAGLESQRDALLARLDPEGTGDLEALLEAPSAIGLAQGGVIDMQQGPDGSSSRDALTVNGRQVGTTGGVGFSVLVGEEGGFTGDEEVLNFDESGRLEDVRPLAGGAAQGASFDFDVDTLKQALSPAFDELGFTSTPTAERAPSGSLRFNDLGGFSGRAGEMFNRLGVRPRLFGLAGGQGGIWFLGDDDVARRVSSPQAFSDFGFQSKDVVQLAPQTVEQLGYTLGGTLTDAPLIEPGVSRRRFPQSTVPRTVEFPGGETLVLPEMKKLASLWRFLSTDTRKIISSALSFGGQSGGEQQRERRAFTPGGSALRAGTVFG